jgi:hypothetical protein
MRLLFNSGTQTEAVLCAKFLGLEITNRENGQREHKAKRRITIMLGFRFSRR